MPILEMIFSRPAFDGRLVVAGRRRAASASPHQAALQAVLEALLRQVGVDRRGADADQHREIVGVEALGRAHDDRDVGAQAPGRPGGCAPRRWPGSSAGRRGPGPVASSVSTIWRAAAQGGVLGLGADAVEVGAQGVARRGASAPAAAWCSR